MQVISNLCKTGLYLKEGELTKTGEINEIVSSYIKIQTEVDFDGYVNLGKDLINHSGTGSSKFLEISLFGENNIRQSVFQVGEKFTIQFTCDVKKLDPNQFYQIRLRSSTNIAIFHWVDFDDKLPPVLTIGMDTVQVFLGELLLYPGYYSISLLVSDRYGTSYDYVEDAIHFQVVEGSIKKLNRQYFPQLGLIDITPNWSRLKD